MGTISSNIGLITGFPIQDTIDKLVALQAAPRDALTAANKKLNDKQAGVAALQALVTVLQIQSSKLAGNLLYSEQNVVSSNTSLLGVTTNGTVAAGNYQFTPIRQVQSQQFTSSRIASDTAPLGSGNFSLRFGGYVDNGTSLDLLNGGQGFDRGSIRIIDRSGATADIDLSTARTIDDVINAINGTVGIHVTAVANNDHLRLIDNTGKTLANLQVQEVGDGTTATSLGLTGIYAASTQADGANILSLFNSLSLSNVSQGNGVRFDDALNDLQLNFRDGTSATVDFHRLAIAGTKARGTTQGALDPNARLTFSAAQAGSAFAGVNVVFQDDNAIVAGSNEGVQYDSGTKTLTFRIRAGQTTANNVIDALKRNPNVSPLFTASNASISTGEGLVSVDDTTTTAGPPATATSLGTLGNDATIAFTAVQGGPAADGVTISFVENPGILAGQETVVYDDSNPNDKRLVFQIAAGQTTADNVIAALANDPIARQIFSASRATGSNGQGLVSVNDSTVTSGGALIEPLAGTNETTLADVLQTLNNVATGKLKAEIAPDGKRLLLTDLTTDNGGTFSVSDLNGAHVAADLGLSGPASGATISGQRLLAGLKTSLLRNLNGGQGFANLGSIQITDHSGATATVDLSQAETLDDVIGAINGAGLGVVAATNKSRDGIQLTDVTGATTSNLIVANGNDLTTTADRLGIANNSATTGVSSGDLKLQVVNENTTLASLNGKTGVVSGSFTITDTHGTSATVSITSSQQTVGDVLDEINSLSLAVHARINDAGDGIVLEDTAHDTGTLKVTEGSSTTAANMHLLGTATTVSINSQPTQVIDGSTTFSVTLSATDSLRDLVQKINDAKVGVSASVFNDGSSVAPFRLILNSQIAGKAGEIRIDASQLPFTLKETVSAQDALLLANTPGTIGLLASSSTNTFKDVLGGATLTVNGSSQTPITISSTSSDKTLATTLSAIVDSYNKIRAKLKDLTSYDPSSNTSGPLFGDSAALRVENDLANLFTNRFLGLGNVQSLQELGINATSDGTLQFDQTTLDAKFAADPGAIQKLFTTAQTGFAARVKTLADQLTGSSTSVLTSRSDALDQTIQNNQDRIDRLTLHLAAVRQQLLNAFIQSETLIAKIKNNLNALSSLSSFAFATPLNTSSSSTSSANSVS